MKKLKPKRCTMSQYLQGEGYNPEDAEVAQNVYAETRSTLLAARSFSWADDDEHDYSGEMFGHIVRWKNEYDPDGKEDVEILCKNCSMPIIRRGLLYKHKHSDNCQCTLTATPRLK